MTGYFLRSCLVLCCMVGVGAFLVPPPPLTPTAGPKPLRALSRTALGAVKTQEDPELTVFDASDVAVSWADYKKQKPNEYKLDEVDEMQCWKTDECPVEDPSKFTKAWRVRSAERSPTMETHFDSEGEWEEESSWSKKWHEDVGEDDLHEETTSSAAAKDGFGI